MGGSNSSGAFEQIGQTIYQQGKQPHVLFTPITPGYLEAIGTRLVRGRDFNEQDRKDTPLVALVNETFTKEFLGGNDPIGQQFKQLGAPAVSIVGVTADVMNSDFEDRRDPQIYVPYAQETWRSMSLVIRSDSEPARLTSAVRGEVSRLDKTLPVFNVKPMERVIGERMSPKRLATAMMAIFAVLALALAGVGIYAVMSYSVSQRTHEIGIRRALGAQPADILKLILSEGLILTSIGLGIGLVGAFATTRAMSQLLYGVTTKDPVTYIGISLMLGLVAMLACYVPTRKALRVDPMVALRYE